MARKKRLKAIVLLPLTYNDGSRILKGTLESVYDEMYAAFDGWTIEGTVTGAYRMESGRKRVEKLVRVSIILNKADLAKVRRLVSKWCATLGQETMLLEIADSIVEFIPPRLKRNEP